MKRLITILLLCLCASVGFAGDLNLGTGVSTTVPAGTIAMYGGTSTPPGWLACDGSAVSRTTYARLFSTIGTGYGAGDTTTTFNVPDLRGVFPKGVGQNGTLGANYVGARGVPTADKAQAHYHHIFQVGTSNITSAAAYSSGGFNGPGVTAGSPPGHIQAQDMVESGTSGTPRTGAITEPANVGVYYIIKY